MTTYIRERRGLGWPPKAGHPYPGPPRRAAYREDRAEGSVMTDDPGKTLLAETISRFAQPAGESGAREILDSRVKRFLALPNGIDIVYLCTEAGEILDQLEYASSHSYELGKMVAEDPITANARRAILAKLEQVKIDQVQGANKQKNTGGRRATTNNIWAEIVRIAIVEGALPDRAELRHRIYEWIAQHDLHGGPSDATIRGILQTLEETPDIDLS